MRIPNGQEQQFIIQEFTQAFELFKPQVEELFGLSLQTKLHIRGVEEILHASSAKLHETLQDIDEDRIEMSYAHFYVYKLFELVDKEELKLNPFSPIWADFLDRKVKSFNNTCTHELLHGIFYKILPGRLDHAANSVVTALDEGFVEYTTHHIIPHWFPDEKKSLTERVFDLCTRTGFRFEACMKEKKLHLKYFEHSLGYRFFVEKFGPHESIATIRSYLEQELANTPVNKLEEEFNKFALKEYEKEFPTSYHVPIVSMEVRRKSRLLQLPFEAVEHYAQTKARHLAGH